MTRRVRVEADEELSAAFPGKQTAVVTLRTKDGRTFTEQVDYPKGEPENPLTEEEFRTRYDGLMAYGGVDRAVSDSIYQKVQDRDTDAGRLVEGL